MPARRTTPPDHGTYARYVSKRWRCRCDKCIAANTDYHNKRRHRLARMYGGTPGAQDSKGRRLGGK